MYQNEQTIETQDAFNQAVSRALYDLYRVAVIAPGTIAAGEQEAEVIATRDDAALRGELANIQAFAFRVEYAKMLEDGSVMLAESVVGQFEM